MIALREMYPQARKILVENKANGPAVEDQLRNEVPRIELGEPGGGKIARANAVEPHFATSIFLPPGAPDWLVRTDSQDLGWIAEHLAFPNVVHDDQVDAATQAVGYLGGSSSVRKFLAAYGKTG
jgi:predicted phage terminase large subunit-like protein